MTPTLLSLLSTPKLEEQLVDWLLEADSTLEFVCFALDAHHSSNTPMSLSEQVAGRRRQILFQIRTDTAQARELLKLIKCDFAGTGLQYWLSPLLEMGRFD